MPVSRLQVSSVSPQAAPSPAHLHLARRATFGATPALVAEIAQLGTQRWLDRQLSPSTIPDPVGDNLLARFPRLALTTAQRRATVTGDARFACVTDLTDLTIARSIWSRRQLFEMTVSAWSDHFNVYNGSEVWDCRASYDQDVIRRHAFGRFADLLQAVETHPAMLRYLSADQSTATAPNENLGRELLELHTVGLNSGFTERDVRASAQVLTGLTVTANGLPVYQPESHYVGPVTVLGWSSANASPGGGPAVIASYLDYLAHHPATASQVARRLAVRFVSDHPSAALVNNLAHHYLGSDTRIDVVLRALFASSEYSQSYGLKVKRPFEDVASTYRALGCPPAAKGTSDLHALMWISAESGNMPLSWPQPNGFPDTAIAWESPSAQVARWTMHYNAASAGWTGGLRKPTVHSLLPGALPRTWADLVDALVRRLTFSSPSPEHRAALLSYVGRSADRPVQGNDWVLTFVLPELLALILGSPYFQVR